MRKDPLIIGIILALCAGLFIPFSREVANGFGIAADIGVALVFLLYGMRLPTREVLSGLANIRLQGSILLATFVIFPLEGWGVATLASPLLGPELARGIFYLSLLPSTVQSSVTFVSIANGNVGAAIAAATLSNIAGMFITPVLVAVFMSVPGADTGGFGSILVKLLLPFIAGQLLQPWFGAWMRSRRDLTKTTDTGAIILVVLTATTVATLDGSWSVITAYSLVVLLIVLALFLALMLTLTWFGSLGLARKDRIVLLMCGSKKSLATGLPMANALFVASLVGTIGIPLIIFHQLQLMVCAVIARKLSRSHL
ncbi:solute carrier family 10 (sodium/bile acid cotransporter), member 7 [Arcanobacterium phocae]|uniref:Solute carrier family 10 (Sodium/bile acid cotransporter), member 7 n=1 Tax=Arcanobacterium phocae TaxID=131112 RepID=A0A1H2LIV9_9ACTO|nr:bile acid:sodium symporter family protein [Arcanobacterium phocae]SDU80950.1 solute carrier family 10 (sodium/bile acid cotransporter), member 7 [Arcanobacterium phocae]